MSRGQLDLSRAPRRCELGLGEARACDRELPLHVKNVGGSIRVDIAREALPGSDEAWDLWNKARDYLTDIKQYEGCTNPNIRGAEDLPVAAFSDSQVEKMIAAGTMRVVPPKEFEEWLHDGGGVGSVIGFTRPEHLDCEKARLRPIRWTVDAYRGISRDFLFAPPPCTRDAVRGAGLDFRFGAALDGKGYFDMFGLHPDLHRLFLFRKADGAIIAATVLAMGFRLASDVGTAFMRLLARSNRALCRDEPTWQGRCEC